MKLNHIFEDAQAACEQYEHNVRLRCEQLESETGRKCEEIISQLEKSALTKKNKRAKANGRDTL